MLEYNLDEAKTLLVRMTCQNLSLSGLASSC